MVETGYILILVEFLFLLRFLPVHFFCCFSFFFVILIDKALFELFSYVNKSKPIFTCLSLYLYLSYIYQQCVTVHHVPKCMSCHKAIVVITGKAHFFHDFIYILSQVFLISYRKLGQVGFESTNPQPCVYHAHTPTTELPCRVMRCA